MRCRFCGNNLKYIFADLGVTPVANSYIPVKKSNKDEKKFPLCAYVCDKCFLVQLDEFLSSKEIFSDYAYFSSYSESWLLHCSEYAETISGRLSLSKNSLVCEVASNDGYLLQYFQKKNIPVAGIEPAVNVAKEAIDKGIPTETIFLTEQTAKKFVKQYGKADLVIANNVLAHVPDLNDFVRGLKILLSIDGVLTIEFPHLFQLIENSQFDTIYHEHFSYYSLYTCSRIFKAHGMRIFDVDTLKTHGGSLRVYVSHDSLEATSRFPETSRYLSVMDGECKKDVTNVEIYTHFQTKIDSIKEKLTGIVRRLKAEGKSIAGYGAPAKGNTLINYCQFTLDEISFTVDLNPHKQNCLLPGSRIPVFSPDKLHHEKPDYVIILPWNIKDEIISQIGFIREWGGRFIIPIPTVEVLE